MMIDKKTALMMTGLGLLFSVALHGCGSDGLAPVTGSATYQGKPATGAAVHFHREGATPEEETNFPMGLVDSEGKFRLETAGVGSGAVPGKYKVLVRWVPEKDANAPPAKGAKHDPDDKKDPKFDSDRLKFRYFRLNQPLLSAEIKPGSNDLNPFELKD